MPTKHQEIHVGILALPATLQASTAKTSSGNTPTFGCNFQSLAQGVVNLSVNVTAVSGTSPSMTLSLQWSDDGGTTFFTADPADQFTAITGAGAVAKQFTIKGNAFRIVYTITGTTPSFTFAVKAGFA